jgi:hypothetical protein
MLIEIGHKKTALVKTLDRLSSPRRFVPKLGPDGQPETRLVANEPVRVTRAKLDGHFCKHKNKRLVVQLRDGDVLLLRPEKTRAAVTASLFDIYGWMVRSLADRAHMARLRERKARKAQARAERAEARKRRGWMRTA